MAWPTDTLIVAQDTVQVFTPTNPLFAPFLGISEPVTAVKGTAILDFGAGATEASVAVTGQTDIVDESSVEAWIRLEDSADHTAAEHREDHFDISAGAIVEGTGFTIYGVSRSGTLTGEYNVFWVWA